LIQLGYVDDDELARLYRGAEVFAYPSRFEGFGIPVLEAMASGVPVVTTPAGAEGIEPSDGVLVETEPDRLAAAARELLTDEAARRERGAAARADFDRYYSPGPATAPLVELYAEMLG
jgi:glycosyltransferase involved in cell wall biosynthesis